MDWPDILRRVQEKESDVTDFKRWEAFPKQVGKAVCAMANTRGGVVVLGIDDDGRIAGGHPRSRNELIANFLLVRRLMEGRGRGIPVIRKAMREFNGTEPHLRNDVEGRYVRIALSLSPP